MIPVSTSVLMVLLKPLQVFSAVQRFLASDHVKAKLMSLQSLSFNDFEFTFLAVIFLRFYDA